MLPLLTVLGSLPPTVESRPLHFDSEKPPRFVMVMGFQFELHQTVARVAFEAQVK